jgi:hypothetical protein
LMINKNLIAEVAHQIAVIPILSAWYDVM